MDLLFKFNLRGPHFSPIHSKAILGPSPLLSRVLLGVVVGRVCHMPIVVALLLLLLEVRAMHLLVVGVNHLLVSGDLLLVVTICCAAIHSW